MASNCARNLLHRSNSSAKTLLSHLQSSHSVSSGQSKLNGLAATTLRRATRRRSTFSSRFPVELGCGESLMPLHSVTASALLNSMLSSKVGQWGILSEAVKYKDNDMETIVQFHPDYSFEPWFRDTTIAGPFRNFQT